MHIPERMIAQTIIFIAVLVGLPVRYVFSDVEPGLPVPMLLPAQQKYEPSPENLPERDVERQLETSSEEFVTQVGELVSFFYFRIAPNLIRIYILVVLAIVIREITLHLSGERDNLR